jgi:hypothetical protein
MFVTSGEERRNSKYKIIFFANIQLPILWRLGALGTGVRRPVYKADTSSPFPIHLYFVTLN